MALWLAFPILVVVAVAVHALWYAYTRTLNETRAHMIMDHFWAVVTMLWATIALISGGLASAIATLLDRRSPARGNGLAK